MTKRTGFATGYTVVGWRHWAGKQLELFRPGLYVLRSKTGALALISVEWQNYTDRPGNYLAIVGEEGSQALNSEAEVLVASGLGDIEMWYGPIQLPAGYLRDKFFQEKRQGLHHDPEL